MKPTLKENPENLISYLGKQRDGIKLGWFSGLVSRVRTKTFPDVSKSWAVCLLVMVVLLRIFMTLRLYRDGFESISADDFGRMVEAAKWAKEPRILWYGPWLPFHSYFFGTLLRIYWDLLWLPRFVTIIFGISTIIIMYCLAKTLFGNRVMAIIAALLMSLNPTHLWLSLTPLTELYCHGLVMLAVLFFILYLQTNKQIWIWFTGVCLAIANGFRFESWVYSAFFPEL